MEAQHITEKERRLRTFSKSIDRERERAEQKLRNHHE
jgi:hypothetical protein